MSLEIRFGFMSPPLVAQLSDSGIDGKTLMIADEDAKAVLRLHFRGFIRDGLRDRMFLRIIKTLERAQAKVKPPLPDSEEGGRP